MELTNLFDFVQLNATRKFDIGRLIVRNMLASDFRLFPLRIQDHGAFENFECLKKLCIIVINVVVFVANPYQVLFKFQYKTIANTFTFLSFIHSFLLSLVRSFFLPSIDHYFVH